MPIFPAVKFRKIFTSTDINLYIIFFQVFLYFARSDSLTIMNSSSLLQSKKACPIFDVNVYCVTEIFPSKMEQHTMEMYVFLLTSPQTGLHHNSVFLQYIFFSGQDGLWFSPNQP